MTKRIHEGLLDLVHGLTISKISSKALKAVVTLGRILEAIYAKMSRL